MTEKKYIWQICDNKRGHENQTSGLIHALEKYIELEIIKIEISNNRASWWQALRRKYPPAAKYPKPDLIIAAGSQTHSTLLAAGRNSLAPTLLVMSPARGLSRLFDLCVVPKHDNLKGNNIIETAGAMNLVEVNPNKTPHTGLFLIGGPSQHHNWDEGELLEQITSILNSNTKLHWKLTTSRRTPASTTKKLQALAYKQLEVIPVEATEADWLPRELAHSAHAWVTEDSVSMVYEALSSGAKVGLLPVPRKTTQSRIIRGLDQLTQQNYVLNYSNQQNDLTLFKSPPPLNEADRIARIVIDKFFQ